jgi:predicted P-type ATPase
MVSSFSIKPLGWLFLLAVSFSSVVVRADFGDAVDPTFNCPAFTTCPQVCVATIQDCPDKMLCSGNQTLCLDGSCADVCDPSLETPCLYTSCAPVACHKVDSHYDTCLNLYGPWYTNETLCADSEQQSAHLWTMREPVFVFMYVWISFLTLSIMAWCAYNQRIAPVKESVQPLNVQVDKLEATSWQTGYRTHPVGLFMYYWTCSTILAFHILLGWLSVQYYVQQGMITGLKAQFEDEANLLKVFEILWMVAVVFVFALKWPYSIKSLFLRRCELHRATHVAVCIQKSGDESEETFDSKYMSFVRIVMSKMLSIMSLVMSFIFSDVDDFGQKKGKNGTYKFCPVEKDEVGSLFFVFGFRHFNFDAEDGRFKPGIFSIGTTLSDILSAGQVKGGLTSDEADARRLIVGPNAIEMDKPNLLKIIIKEFGTPFYTYQTFMVWTWFPLYYFYMAFIWSAVIATGGLTVSYFQYRNECKLYEITNITGEVSVMRDGQVVQASPKDLVPGDIVEVRPGLTYCDMVVVTSSTILIDESALTGEATPMVKTSIDLVSGGTDYSTVKHKRNTILAGTRVLETEGTIAVVTQTASYTARGDLIRDIYSYKRHQFKFDVEVPMVISILCFYAIFGFVMVCFFIKDTIVYSWFYGMFVVATVLPPLLPTVFTVSVGISSDRLARKQISCTNPDAILIAGKVDLAFFDKTGTLTKQGLDFVAANVQKGFESEFSLALASCHTLSLTQAGELAGNPVDRSMFEQSSAVVNSSSGPIRKVTDRNGKAAKVVRHFDFDHHRMTQSVVVCLDSDDSLIAFVKGSGESIKKVCEKDSLPSNFDEALQQTAISGIYQIAVAMKKLPPSTDISTISREAIEDSLVFIGTVDFKNIIREETLGVIDHLHSGSINTIMLTGDSVLTGICIAKEAGILGPKSDILVGSCDDSGSVYWSNVQNKPCMLPPVDELIRSGTELAISGQAWDVLRTADPKTASGLVSLTRVYGRCTPQTKIDVVTAYCEMGHITLMCGDGGKYTLT